MSNVTHIGSHPNRGACHMCGTHEPGAMHPVTDEDGNRVPTLVRCTTCVEEWGDGDDVYVHVMGRCDPVIDDDTRWQLLSLMSGMVKRRDKTGDPEDAELVRQIGKIIERHEP